MRLQNIINMAKDYLILGIILVFLISIVYLLIFKIIKKNSRKPSKRKFILSAIFICYMVVVLGATMFSRFGYGQGVASFHLFYSYKEAWNSFSKTEWRNIILNICMFMPLGFLLPLLSDKFKSWWKTYLAGFVTTLSIELLQLITHRGIFELDDILNNLWGAMIGYGLIIIVLDIFAKKDKRKSNIWMKLSYQVPLLILIITFSTIFIKYNSQEYGNLPVSYVVKVNMSDVEVKLNTDLEVSETRAMVYKLHIADQEETLNYAKNFFAKLGKEIDESKNDIYEETAIYKSGDENYSIWIDYAGLTINFRDFSNLEEEGKRGCSLEEIKAALKEYDIELPETVDFQEEDGSYNIIVNKYLEGNKLLDGSLSCIYSGENKLISIRNCIREYEKYKECSIISKQDAYEQLKEGKFQYPSYYDKVHTIDIESVELSYALDSKGFYQPVYEFKCIINGEKRIIVIPAMKK